MLQTVYEAHDGEFAGCHARYILKSKDVRLFDRPPASHCVHAERADHV